MLKIAKSVEYAVLALKYINDRQDLNCVSTKLIAESLDIPYDLLAKIMQKLVKNDIIISEQGTKGGYKENDTLLPNNNYAWSKLGGESSVMMYKNSLILRLSMTEKPFVHKKAFSDYITNFIFHDEVAKYILKLLNETGIINVGGKAQSVFKFAKKYNSKIKKNSAKQIFGSKYPLNPSMNIDRFKKIIKS